VKQIMPVSGPARFVVKAGVFAIVLTVAYFGLRHHARRSVSLGEAGPLAKFYMLLKLGNAPVEFRGMVVDENDAGLENATIRWRVHRAGYFSPVRGAGGVAVTDARGRFSLTGEEGRSLEVVGIGKEGYRETSSAYPGFLFDMSPGSHRPDPGKPVKYLLVGKDLPHAVRIVEKRLPIAWNQGAMRIATGSAAHELVITATRRREPGQIRGFAWAVDVASSDAGLVELEAGAIRLAPLSGYGANLMYAMAADDPGWQSDLEKDFAYKGKSGEYGILKIHVSADREDGEPALMFEIHANTQGGRTLN
jgi:hypothetical protein